jgi:hypothetical protein
MAHFKYFLNVKVEVIVPECTKMRLSLLTCQPFGLFFLCILNFSMTKAYVLEMQKTEG